MIKFVSDLRQVGVFFQETPVSSTNKTDRNETRNVRFHFNGNTSYLPTSTLNTKYIWAVLIKLHDSATYDDRRLEAQWTEPVSLTFHSALRKFNTEPSIGASHQISVHFAKAVSDKKIFRKRPI